MSKIYVASSWRNDIQPDIVARLRCEGHNVYDFRNPSEGNWGFGWEQIDRNYQRWTFAKFVKALEHPIAVAGFDSDFNAMKQADICVLLLPCGRSAHLEAGWFIGQGKPVGILLNGLLEPELMYKMADIFIDLAQLITWLKGIDNESK